MSLNCKMIISLIDWLKLFMSAILGGFGLTKLCQYTPEMTLSRLRVY